MRKILKMVRNGMGMKMIKEIEVSEEERRKNMRIVNLEGEKKKREIEILWRRKRMRGKDFREIEECIEESDNKIKIDN